MKEVPYTADVVDFAYQVINMDNRIKELERNLAHTEKLLKINEDAGKRHGEHSKEMIGIMLCAALDPESSINQGGRAIAELEQIKLTKENGEEK